jgi:type III secretion protein Q
MSLPFDLPAVSRAFGELSTGARSVGHDTASAAARALSKLLAREVAIAGNARPGPPGLRSPAPRVAIDLAALPAQAVLEVEPALVVRLVDLLAGGPGTTDGATTLTPIETAALELFALVALDGAVSVPTIERALAPRLAGALLDMSPGLAIDLDVTAGDVSGRARLLVPLAAVRALRGPPAADAPALAIAIPASLRGGSVTLLRDELEALAPGDVLVFEPLENGREDLVLPGGTRARGQWDDGDFQVEEMAMTDRRAELPVTLEVELARVEVPLREIARLEPGAALPLPIDRRGLVTLRVGERPVARGELVDLEGAVGVRILSIEVAP